MYTGVQTRFSYQLMFMLSTRNMTGDTCGAGIPNPPGAPEFSPGI